MVITSFDNDKVKYLKKLSKKKYRDLYNEFFSRRASFSNRSL